MTTPRVWVSTTSPQIHFDGQSPGEHWEFVGTINTSQEEDFHTYVQVLLGLRRSTRGRPEFYLDGDADSRWVQAAHRERFWVAIDPWGDQRSYIHGARPTYFVSSAQAVVTALARRAPEIHPGSAVRPIKIPIRLSRRDGELFTKWEAAET